jgi:hypothetical protein
MLKKQANSDGLRLLDKWACLKNSSVREVPQWQEY